MGVKSGYAAAVLLGLTAITGIQAQAPPPAGGGQNRVRPAGGFVPGQHRPPGDPAQIAHGKALYTV